MTVFVWVYFWALYSVPLIYLSVLVPILEKAMAPHSSTLAWKNPMDGGAWWAAVHGIAKSQTRLSDFTFTSHFPALEKEMATHSSVLAWRIPGTREAPRNLHVQLIVGYNKITGDFIIYDPWTRTSGQYEFTLSKSKVSNLYSSVGSMAIVVR